MPGPRILLLQARNHDDPMKSHELNSFAQKCALGTEAFTSHDLLAGPPSRALVRSHDVVMVGGSGDYYVSNRSLPQFDAHLESFAWIVEASLPMFASCFGHQILVAALGGEVEHAPEDTEVGTYELTLTEEGVADPLLGSLPTRFMAQMGRKDRATAAPVGLLNLASSERCRVQALRLPGKPVWSTQFHPELDRESNWERYEQYIDGYSRNMSSQERAEIAGRFRPSPHTDGLLRSFLDLVLG